MIFQKLAKKPPKKTMKNFSDKELSMEQLEIVRGGMQHEEYSIWRANLLSDIGAECVLFKKSD